MNRGKLIDAQGIWSIGQTHFLSCMDSNLVLVNHFFFVIIYGYWDFCLYSVTNKYFFINAKQKQNPYAESCFIELFEFYHLAIIIITS